MSGTSLDGIDLGLFQFMLSDLGAWNFEIIVAETTPYTHSWKNRLKAAVAFSDTDLRCLNSEYTRHLSEVILTFITNNNIENLDAVCSHGHTILHQPSRGFTLQIGNLPELAALIKQTVICDFRVQDVALGGQGAPLVPIGDRLLFGQYDYCLNLGGFANVSSELNGKRIAYDICPVNIVLNRYAEKLGEPFDTGGRFAAKGKVNSELLKKLEAIPFYSQTPPKSLGLEWVIEQFFPILEASGLSNIDILSTVSEHIAIQIAAQFQEGASVLITGGGAYNKYLIARIKAVKTIQLVLPLSNIIEFKEALIFGLLGVLRLRDEPNCLASVTGARKDHSSGFMYFP
jgi:anhydro-N-acetylmuramic acid kinase